MSGGLTHTPNNSLTDPKENIDTESGDNRGMDGGSTYKSDYSSVINERKQVGEDSRKKELLEIIEERNVRDSSALVGRTSRGEPVISTIEEKRKKAKEEERKNNPNGYYVGNHK